MGDNAVVLGLDIGTSSSKAVLVDAGGTVVARATRPHGTSTPHPGWFEQDADTVWWGDLVALTRELAATPDVRITAVGISGLGPCVLPTDAQDRPVRPGILYGIDTRAGAQIDELDALLGEAEILRQSGNRLTSQAVGPKLLWVRQNEPDAWSRTRRFHTTASFLVARLTGEYVLDHHSASQSAPLYRPADRDWNREWCAQLFPELELPALAWPEDVVGTVTAEAAAATGLPQGIPVTAGTIDAWAEGVSVGATGVGDVMVMYGTTMFITAVTEQPLSSPGLWSTAGARRDTFTLAAGMATSGAVTDWFRRITGEDYAGLVDAAGEVPAGSRGLLMLPYFAGERTPLFEPDARGVVAGLTLDTGRGELYRAILEAIAFGVRHNLQAFTDAGARLDRLVAVGGGSQSALWPRIVSSVTGFPQQLTRENIGAALGDAYLAAVATGLDPDITEWNPVVGETRPDGDWQQVYDRLWPHYLGLHTSTRGIQQVLAQLSRERTG
ncbi:sugar kinase [Nakamurella sp. YIM 132087]|uniref:Sugar kinase n=1 Tax=Nakamurella alba TaxID=2665158 RepID=A0A7K1FSV1_9ACTN|nr:FGGY-family carbohydrate kinase [Nakamurella alba]MTD17232.1 sugar kinase [Nakamurella alba]